MPLSELTDEYAVYAALEEAETLGRHQFSKRYGFGEATKYPVRWNGRDYDSKAIAAVAYGYQFPERGALKRTQLSGGVGPNNAAAKLRSLGFSVNGEEGWDHQYIYEWMYYWADFRESTSNGALLQVNQHNPATVFIQPHTRVWVVTPNWRGLWALAAYYAIEEVGKNRSGTREAEQGRYFFRAKSENVVYFQLDDQPNVAWELQKFGVAPPANGVDRLFRGLAAIRPIYEHPPTLHEFAAAVAVDDGLTSDEAIAWWSRITPYSSATVGNSTPARREQTREFYVRDQAAVRELKNRYQGVCQISGLTPLEGVAGDITEAHHIEWLTRGGSDTTDNMVVLSPNWHRAIHTSDASFNWRDLSFTVNGQKVPLAVNRHLKRRP